jgi:hypothetical protein
MRTRFNYVCYHILNSKTVILLFYINIQYTENRDCLWDDGVAPELALDFDAPNVSSSEALWTLMGAFGVFVIYYNIIKYTVVENPALGHETDCVYPDYSQPDVIPPAKK